VKLFLTYITHPGRCSGPTMVQKFVKQSGFVDWAVFFRVKENCNFCRLVQTKFGLVHHNLIDICKLKNWFSLHPDTACYLMLEISKDSQSVSTIRQ